jgi:formylglycine-generating enzyme required for sulfatase activity
VNPSAQSGAVTKDNPFTNTLGMKFVPVPGTDVLFCIHEVRYKDYAAYAAEESGGDGSWKKQVCDGFATTERAEDHPVMNVSWEDAQKFCAWLSKKEGKTYRLPTDREWSYAVGIGQDEKWDDDTTPATVTKNQTDFPWGKQWPPPQHSGNFSDESRKAKAPHPEAQYIDRYEDGFPTTAPVMSFQANKFGIHDMEGNVREWVEKWYDNANQELVLRGASWRLDERGHLLSSHRGHHTSGYRTNHYGFRVVLVSGTEPAAGAPEFPAPPSSLLVQPAKPAVESSAASDFTNTLGMKFVPVPGTKVWFCIHETRRQDYAAYANGVPGIDGTWKTQQRDGIPCGDKDDHPVVGVSWEDAAKFCEWLSKNEGKTYRLPTDEEWSIAVGLAMKEKRVKGSSPETLHGKENTGFPWGDDYPPTTNDRAGNYADSAFLEKFSTDPGMKDYTDGFPTTAPVMSFKANKIGLYDMGGNVWEWVEDWWNTTKTDRVLRGGAFGDYAQVHLLSSHRLHRTPGFRNNGYGFRVVIEPATTTTGRIPVQLSPLGAAAKWAVQPWTDGLAAWWNGTKNNECFSLHPDGTTRQNCDFGILTAIHENSPVVRDQAARVKARFDGDWGDGSDLFRVYVRRTKNAAGVFSNYTAGLNRSGHIRLGFYQGSVYTGLRNFTLPANFNFGLHHTLELRAVGDELTVFLDGTELGRLKHSGIREGHPALFAKKGAIIASFEYQVLDP